MVTCEFTAVSIQSMLQSRKSVIPDRVHSYSLVVCLLVLANILHECKHPISPKKPLVELQTVTKTSVILQVHVFLIDLHFLDSSIQGYLGICMPMLGLSSEPQHDYKDYCQIDSN